MTSYRHLFVIDPIEKLNLKLDSSLRMAFALTKRKQRCFITSPKEISKRHCSRRQLAGTWVQAQEIMFGGTAADLQLGAKTEHGLASFQGIQMRKDPPFDMDYLAATWLLDEAHGSSIVYNDPQALRRWNEKLIIMRFPQYTLPACFSSDPEQILKFIADEAGGDGILKPLDLFGGRGVLRIQLDLHSLDEQLAMIRRETQDGEHYRLAQPFDSKIFDGEVRVFCAGNEPLAWCLKKPQNGEFLANTRLGAVLLPYHPTEAETKMVRDVTSELMREGIFLTGFDLIDGKISEINITSPRMLTLGQDEEQLYDRLASLLVQDMEQRLT